MADQLSWLGEELEPKAPKELGDGKFSKRNQVTTLRGRPPALEGYEWKGGKECEDTARAYWAFNATTRLMDGPV
jgi:hypothetical protein